MISADDRLTERNLVEGAPISSSSNSLSQSQIHEAVRNLGCCVQILGRTSDSTGDAIQILGNRIVDLERALETLRKLPHIDPKRVSMEMESLHAFVAQNDTLLKDKFTALANLVNTLKTNCNSFEAVGRRASDMVESVTQLAESVHSRMDRMEIIQQQSHPVYENGSSGLQLRVDYLQSQLGEIGQQVGICEEQLVGALAEVRMQHKDLEVVGQRVQRVSHEFAEKFVLASAQIESLARGVDDMRMAISTLPPPVSSGADPVLEGRVRRLEGNLEELRAKVGTDPSLELRVGVLETYLA